MNLKKRLIAVLFVKNGFIVRSEKFIRHQIIGDIVNQAKRLNQWNADELIYIDISREKIYDSKRDDLKFKSINSKKQIVQEVSKVCRMPLTFGGGIRSFQDASEIIENGGDKVVVNFLLHTNHEEIKKIINVYGSQAVVASIDYRKINNELIVYSKFGEHNTNNKLFEIINLCEKLKVGELFFQNIDLDGSGSGYDIDTIQHINSISNLPAIFCSGAGKIDHFKDVLSLKEVEAVAVGNYLNFSEHSYIRIKKNLRDNNINVR